MTGRNDLVREIKLAAMALISTIKCDMCDLQLPTGAGGHMYVISPTGERVVCPHPLEEATIKRVTKLDWSAARAKGLLGHISDCVCFECSEQFNLDVERDVKRCPKCGSLDVRTANASVGASCPKCHEGTLISHAIGVS